jgi:uncharacterized membrane protein YeiH
MHKIFIRYTCIFLLFFIQVLFLLAIFKERSNSYLIVIFIASILVFVLYTYLKKPIHLTEHSYESISVALWVPVGAVCSYYLNHNLGLNSVLGASITGTVASFIPVLKKESAYLQKLPASIYCGAFVGMSSNHVANSFSFVLTASVFTGVFLVVSKSILHGIGGKLGTLAFLGVAITYLLLFLFK